VFPSRPRPFGSPCGHNTLVRPRATNQGCEPRRMHRGGAPRTGERLAITSSSLRWIARGTHLR
jgi:hypothetical protein